MATARRGGGITKRCECRGDNGKLLGTSCPQLARKNHGRPSIRQELPPGEGGGRRTFRRTGYETVTDAQADLDRLRTILDLPGDDEDAARRVGDLLADIAKRRAPIPKPEEVSRRLGVGIPLNGQRTVGDLLDAWLAAKRKARRAGTTNGYDGHVRNYLRPALGHYRSDRLGVQAVQDMFDEIAEHNDVIRAENEARREQVERCKWTKPGRPPTVERERLAVEKARLAEMKPFRRIADLGTQHAIRRSLRAALNWAMARPEYGVTFNAAAHVELTTYRRPRGLLWTQERVQRWRQSGEIPSKVMVWRPDQLGQFLDAAESSRHYVGFLLVGYHAMRRSEAVGAAWEDLDAQARVLMVSTAVTVDGWTPVESEPKTDGSAAPVSLDAGTLAVCGEHRKRQLAERDARLAAGLPWTDSGKILTNEDGTPIHPHVLSDEFERIRDKADLPPITLRDLRHVGAGLVKAAGGDIDDAKVKLRHQSVRLTSDTYMVMFQEMEQTLAEGVVAVVPRAKKSDGGNASKPD
ncbi:tyrosine-type recombinase/integrase [Streptomyces aculeolatus]